jgi:putative transposase
MVSPPTHAAKEERDEGDQLQRGPFPTRHYSDGRPLVYRLPLEHTPRRRTHARTWGPHVDHSTINRWVVKYSPQLEEAFHRRKRAVWVSWRMDETYIKVKGQWRYLYRAVDKYGQTIDFLLTEHRDKEAALRFLKKAIRRNGLPETITIDGSDANEAAIKRYNEEHGTAIVIRQVKYLNNIVEQDHRAVKRITRPMLGFKAFEAAQGTLAGVELMHMIKKRQLKVEAGDEGRTAAELFYALAA